MTHHAKIYVVAIIGMVVSLANGTLIEGGAHLLIVEPWSSVIKISSILAIVGWFVEGFSIWRQT